MTRDDFVPQVRDPYIGLLTATRLAGEAALPEARLTDREKMAGVVRTATEAVLDDMGPIAQDAAATIFDELAGKAPGNVLRVTQQDVLPPPPPTVRDIDAIVGEFIKNTYGPGALADPAYKTEIQWVRDEIAASARDKWLDSLELSVAKEYNWSIGEFGANIPEVVGYQRIARPNACAFCRVVALNQYTSFGDEGGYHKNCYCYAVPIFRGQGPYRPDYYDEFERQYFQYRDQAPGEDYNARALQTPPKRTVDGRLIPDPAEERRRETFRNIRAGIKSEEAPAIPQVETRRIGLTDVQRSPIHNEFFSMNEMNALEAYVGDSFSDINRGARNGFWFPDEANSVRIPALDALAERSEIVADQVVYRGTTTGQFFPLPVNNPDEATQRLSALVGKEITDPGFMSTSQSLSIASDFADARGVALTSAGSDAVIIRINVPKGAKGIDVEKMLTAGDIPLDGPVAREREIILPRNSRFQVTGVLRNGLDSPVDHILIEMDLIP